MLFGICPRTSHTPKFWHTYMVFFEPCYNFQFNCVSGNQLFVADMPSRSPKLDSTSEIESDYFVCSVIKTAQNSEDCVQQIKSETKGQYISINCVKNLKWADRSRYSGSQTILMVKDSPYRKG